MSRPKIEAKDERIRRLIALAAIGAIKLSDSKIDAAADHARASLTNSLSDTPDGRATARKARQSRSGRAAQERLDELLDLLAGPTRTSGDGLLRDSAEAAYRSLRTFWRTIVPDDLHGPDSITAAQVAGVRGLVLHGYELRDELAGPISQASRDLLAATTRAGRQGLDRATRADSIETWRLQARARLRTVLMRIGSDQAYAVDGLAMRDTFKPGLLEPL
jgi:hypothetical protein